MRDIIQVDKMRVFLSLKEYEVLSERDIVHILQRGCIGWNNMSDEEVEDIFYDNYEDEDLENFFKE